jgi:hypothetical protein
MFLTNDSRSFKLRNCFLMIIALLSSMEATAQSQNPILENIPPDEWDAKMYSVSAGISLEEAKQRFKVIDKIGGLEEKLNREEPDTFAGLWLEHTPKLRLVAQFSGGTKRDISAYMSEELTAISEVRSAQVSLLDLKRMRGEALDAIALEGEIPIESDINIRKNRIELYVTGEHLPKSSNAIKNRGISFSKSVAVIPVSSLSSRQIGFYGGFPLQQTLPTICQTDPTNAVCLPNCTSGFSVISVPNILGLSTRGITTAAHCTDTRTYNGINLPFKKGLDTGSYDIQWHTTPGYTPTNAIKVSATAIRVITFVKPSIYQFVGEYVCKYGISSGYTCGYITSKTFTPLNHSATFIRVSSSQLGSGIPTINLSNPSDSGGPWFREGFAYGTHVGQPPTPGGNDAYYMPINYISGLSTSGLTGSSVSVLTNP